MKSALENRGAGLKFPTYRSLLAGAIIALLIQDVEASGVSPYLPLSMSPQIERQIERVLILADKPVMRRPIPAAVVLEALPIACRRDQVLCDEVSAYLERYMHRSALTSLQLGAAYTHGDSTATIPNSHGESVNSRLLMSASAYFQPNDYMLVSAGGIVHDGDATPTGSVISLGFDYAQLDVGFRDHWFSPLTDSSSLISTEAPTMPSITLSNYAPITPLGISYEVFLASMSKQDNIRYFDSTTSGRPHLAGMQIGIEPASGYSLAISRLFQYGGGARTGGGLSQFIDALTKNSNRPDVLGQSQEFGNQVASITSSVLFPGRIPFAVHIEYAGEDNAYAGSYRLGDTNISWGVDIPVLWQDFDVGYEISEWQNGWYVHNLYPRGLTNSGNVIGHWFGDERLFGNAIGGQSHMLRFGWRHPHGEYIQATYRTMALDPAWAGGSLVPTYERYQALGLSLSTAWRDREIQVELSGGRDVFGKSFAKLAGSMDLAERKFAGNSLYEGGEDEKQTDVFLDVGASDSVIRKILDSTIPNFSLPSQTSLHLGIGARRAVSTRSDLGTRLEFDQIDGHSLLSLRALDYRYRFTRKFAASGFFGVGRYSVGLPAHGYYWGAGLQYMDFVPKWDLGFDIRHHEKLGRDKELPTDPVVSPNRTRLFFDVNGVALYVSRRW